MVSIGMGRFSEPSAYTLSLRDTRISLEVGEAMTSAVFGIARPFLRQL
jgi:hypothetical protein